MFDNKKLRVMLTTEGTYPFHHGGVSTWCDVLVKRLKNIDYVLYSILMNPYVTQKFSLPNNADLIKVPLWGTEDAAENLKKPFSEIYLTKKITTQTVIESQFVPLFKIFIQEIMTMDKNPIRFAHTLFNMYNYFKEYDYTLTFKSEIIWEEYKEFIFHFTLNIKNSFAVPSIFDLTQSLGWLYRFFTVLNTPLPEINVAHSAAAAFCGIPCVLSKFERGTPYLLTEHGVYLREQYLAVNRSSYSPYLKTFLIRLIHSIVILNYHFADSVSPVCRYNTRWERVFGVSTSKINVIYNGVDNNIFLPATKPLANLRPTVVTVSRIDPVKDLITLLKSAAMVKETISDVQFLVYGTVNVPEYYDECLAAREQLGLDENTFVFAGHTDDVPAALKQADVVALSSITEAFPYSVVEAMMSGKAIVATDVGGVSEALGDCGLVVPPRKPEEFARAIITLLQDVELRHTLEEDAHKRALDFFTIENAIELYMKAYRKLSFKTAQNISDLLKKQKLYVEKGYALLELGFKLEAIEQFKLAIKAVPSSQIVPLLYADMASTYAELGKLDAAKLQLEKAQLMSQLVQDEIA
ncbi:MAG: N,N'-diacetylbacillosaminyl-diphospho-undecaprenol alpha-1,3-N-acetylgalactosaminyltransferase [Candidatus Dichloromethanomonas elyunquensis]|nr:MAG: N,N'-diacetylbacillosaminyl-diphospho-undecaprenol alpha-1,3-N-acetylgalactosaminyltransferase [Candidatus Dichloromethanomonas elyunquensis]